MRPSTDPAAWLAEADPCSAREAWDLFAATATLRNVGLYRCQSTPDGRTVRLMAGHVRQALVMRGPSGRQRLLDALIAWCQAQLPQVTLPEIVLQPGSLSTASGWQGTAPVRQAGAATPGIVFRPPAA